MTSKFAFYLNFECGSEDKQVKAYSPEESDRILAPENVHFSTGNYERRSSKFADENAKCVEFDRSYSYLRLIAPCNKTARTKVKFRVMASPSTVQQNRIKVTYLPATRLHVFPFPV